MSGRVPGAHSTIVVVDREAGGAVWIERQPVSSGDANKTAIRFESVNSFLMPFSLPRFRVLWKLENGVTRKET